MHARTTSPLPHSARTHSGHGALLQRQCACGGVCEACRSKKGLQAKRVIGARNDPLEQEAEQVADQVLATPASPVVKRASANMQRATGQAGDVAGAAPASVDQVLASSGSPMDSALQQDMGQRFGHDFSRVRVHTDMQAARSARAVDALAYTVGQNIVFGTGQYAPATSTGRKLLAHELTHVLQQTDAPHVLQRFGTQDCEKADVTRIDESHKRAIEEVKAAIQRLTADPVTAETQRHFANHFGGYGTWRRDIVVGHFKRDLELLNASEMTYECESECDEGEPAYTYWVFGDIHICLPWLRSQVLNERAETFIHEMHHWDAGRGHLDLGYHKNNQDNNTSWVVAVNNADAYSELAQDLYEQP